MRPADQLVIDAIRRHEALPVHYLYEFQKHLRTDYTFFKKCMKKLVDAGLLRRPLKLNNPLILTDRYVYDVPEGRDHTDYVHALETAAVTSNIELEATKAGFTYIPRQEFGNVFFKTDAKYPTRPDAVFAIHYGTMKRFFVLEADRGTETIQKIIREKFRAYDYILKHETFKPLPRPWILFVTTTEARMKSMLAEYKDFRKEGSTRVLFAFTDCIDKITYKKKIKGKCTDVQIDRPFSFYPYLYTPPLMPKLFSEYERAGNEPFDISKP